MSGRRELLLSALLALFFLLTGGCARRAPLRAPEEIRPAPVRDLQVRQLNGEVELSWSRPQKSEAGRRLEEIAAFIIERQCLGLQETTFSAFTTVATGERGRFRKVGSYRYRHALDPASLPCRYRVVSKTYDGYLSQPSNVVEIGP
ncbi:MAG: hypothetical protein N3C12_03040 [Candidatus Binatia bacterium]|nr:hypothetical protein [Candidatus Binatia bacterium]